MTKEELIEIIQGILKMDINLSLLLQVENSQPQTVVASIREGPKQIREQVIHPFPE